MEDQKSTLMQECKNDPVMTPEEVADLFRVEVSTVARWALRGWLPGFKTPGNTWRFRWSVIQCIYVKGLDSASQERSVGRPTAIPGRNTDARTATTE